jgi:sulfur-carrier protein adenylyltransferase/sulfurtransferase
MNSILSEIPVPDARSLLRDNHCAVVIDIRGTGETCLGYIEGAHFIPPGALEGEVETLSIDKHDPIVLYCSSGARSLRAAEKLKSLGFTHACSIRGGYIAWLNEGGEIVHDSKFTVDRLNRYSRNMLLKEIGEEGQSKLMDARVLLVGAGGLASSAAPYLAAAGVETLGIIDFDAVDLSNLNRQIIHGTADVGRLKVDSAKSSILRINPDVTVITFPERLTTENALEVIGGFDIVMDASDNLDTKFLINDACYFTDKPYVFGGAVGFDGQASVFWSREGGPCLRCLFPKPPPRHLVPT